MDWTQLIGPGIGVAGVFIGGLFMRGKTKADSHSVIVTDATSYAQSMRTDLDQAMRRIDQLEERQEQRDRLARQHLHWDWDVLRRLADKGITVPEPPPLFVYDNPTKGV